MDFVSEYAERVLSGENLGAREGIRLYEEAPLERLCALANELRERICGNRFDLCSIVNGKNGRCTENCKFCAQSSFARATIAEHSLLSVEEFVSAAKRAAERGVARFSIVTAGRKLARAELSRVCEAIRRIRAETSLAVCGSLGLLDASEFAELRAAGMTRAHNNLETSRRFFPQICTTHTYDEKLSSLRAAREAGLSLCSGGIFGMGETIADRVDMALTLRALEVESIPINILNAIPGTTLGTSSLRPLTSADARRLVAVFRFLTPRASIRLAGGRTLLSDLGVGCFSSGANATITGDMLTTVGADARTDKRVVESLGYKTED